MIKSRANTKMRIASGVGKVRTGRGATMAVGRAVASGATGSRTGQAAAAARTSANRS